MECNHKRAEVAVNMCCLTLFTSIFAVQYMHTTTNTSSALTFANPHKRSSTLLTTPLYVCSSSLASSSLILVRLAMFRYLGNRMWNRITRSPLPAFFARGMPSPATTSDGVRTQQVQKQAHSPQPTSYLMTCNHIPTTEHTHTWNEFFIVGGHDLGAGQRDDPLVEGGDLQTAVGERVRQAQFVCVD